MISWRTIVLMTLSCALAVSPIYYNQPLLPQMASAFDMPVGRGALIATLTQLGYAAGLLLFVPLADSIQPRTLASRVITANAVALIACAMAPTFLVLAACSFVVGMTAITAQMIIPSVSGIAAPEVRGRVVGALVGGLSSGVLLARTLSGAVGALLGWRSIFVLASVIDVALLVVIRELPVSTMLVAIRYRELMRSLASKFRQERLLRISSAMGFLVFGAFSALWASLAALLVQSPYHYGPATIGAFGLVGIAGLTASPLLGSIVDRVGARNIASAGTIAVAVGFGLVSAGGRSLACLIAGMVLLDMGNRANVIANQIRIYSLHAEARSRLNTVFMVSYFLGGAFGAALGSLGVERGAWLGLAAVGAVLSLVALAINLLTCWRPSETAAIGRT